MPELPEVETIVRQLQPVLDGQQLQRAQIFDSLLSEVPTRRLACRQVTLVARMGKQIVIGLGASKSDADSVALAIHLRMTGRLVWHTESYERAPEHCRACFQFERGHLLFVDTRRFGTIRLAKQAEAFLPDGIEPLSSQFNGRAFHMLRGSSQQEVKGWLLRQDRIVGIGNIYACEALFRARISPWRPVSKLTPQEIQRLCRAIKSVLRAAIKNCGTTFSDFQNAHGLTGSYQRYLKVYRRDNAPCPSCKKPIQRVNQKGRSTFFCGNCQL